MLYEIIPLGACPRMRFYPNSSLFTKNNARNIHHMTVLVFCKCLDLKQISEVRDFEISILGQPPRTSSRVDKKGVGDCNP